MKYFNGLIVVMIVSALILYFGWSEFPQYADFILGGTIAVAYAIGTMFGDKTVVIKEKS